MVAIYHHESRPHLMMLFSPLARCCLAFALLTAICSSAAANSELALKEVADGVWVHQGRHEIPDRNNLGEIANIGFIVGARCVAVIDTGGSPSQGQALLAAVKKATQIPICYVINTHVHPDHIYGNGAFNQRGITFVGHYKLSDAMAERAGFYMEKAERDLGFKLKPTDFVAPTYLVKGKDDLDLGGLKLRLVAHATAHTDSDLSVFDDKTQTLWASDLLFLGHLPVIDGSLLGWIKELEALRMVKAELVVPGHGPVVEDWPAAADRELKYLIELKADVRQALKDHKTFEQALDQISASTASDWMLYDEFHKRNVSKAFAELEWED